MKEKLRYEKSDDGDNRVQSTRSFQQRVCSEFSMDGGGS